MTAAVISVVGRPILYSEWVRPYVSSSIGVPRMATYVVMLASQDLVGSVYGTLGVLTF